jgi:hypothetical protein
MTVETSQLLKALKRNSVRWAMRMVNLSITLGELGCVTSDTELGESCLMKAKKAYALALTKGRRAFTAKECSDFEFRSFRAETLIAKLEVRLANQRIAQPADEPVDESLAS